MTAQRQGGAVRPAGTPSGVGVPALKPQTRACLELLQRSSHGVTAYDALAEIGCFRLAARVAELRELGYAVTSETIRTASGKHISRYRLEEAHEQLAVGW